MSQSSPPTGSPPPGSTQFDPDAELDAGLDADAGVEDSVQRELADLEQQVAAAREEVLRTRADMDNTRKRLSRELETVRRYAAERVLADLLPVIDSLDQGLTALPQDDPGREGLELTRRQLLTAMERHGLVILDPQGEAFDPAEHQAISDAWAAPLREALAGLDLDELATRLAERPVDLVAVRFHQARLALAAGDLTMAGEYLAEAMPLAEGLARYLATRRRLS